MQPIILSYTPADDDTDGFANDVNTTSGLPFTLAATTVGDGLAHKVIITPSGSVTGSYTLTGTDADGIAQTETLATNTTSAVTSAKYYKTLTSVLAPSGIGAATVDIGWTDVSISPTLPTNWKQSNLQISLGCTVSGTINYTVQHTFQNVLHGTPSTFNWFSNSGIVGDTTSQDGNYAFPVTAVRLLINSLTAGATITFSVVQGD